jgi:hypothetical protein
MGSRSKQKVPAFSTTFHLEKKFQELRMKAARVLVKVQPREDWQIGSILSFGGAANRIHIMDTNFVMIQ